LQIELKKHRHQSGLTNLLLVILKRLVAIFLLVFAVLYWARIVGAFEASSMRFDTMSEPWQIASVVLAVTMPIAAIGLWGLFSWGTSTWLLIVLIELSMFVWLKEYFGEAYYIVLFHSISLATYIALKLSLMVTRKLTKRSNLQPVGTN